MPEYHNIFMVRKTTDKLEILHVLARIENLWYIADIISMDNASDQRQSERVAGTLSDCMRLLCCKLKCLNLFSISRAVQGS